MLTQEERIILENAKKQGKTKEQAIAEISQYRIDNPPKPSVIQDEKPSFLEGIKEDFNTRVENAADAQIAALEGEQSDTSAALQSVGQGAGLVGDLVNRGLSAITPDFIKDKLKAGVQKVAETKPVQSTMAKYNEWKAAHPEAAANLEAGVNVLSLVPGGKVAVSSAQSLTDAALIGTGKTFVGVSNLLDGTGNAIKGAGGVLYRSAITPNVKEAERLLAYRANNPLLTRVSDTLEGIDVPPRTRGQTALEQGIYGTEEMIGTQAKRLSDTLWKDEIAPAVKNSTVQMTKEELFAPAVARINAITDPTRRQAMANALEALIEDYRTFDNSFDLTKAQALKRDLDQFTPAKVYKGQDVASEVRMLQHDMADAIRQKTYESLEDVNIKKKYLDWANLHELETLGVKAISEAKFKGGSGTLIGGLWDAAVTPIKTIGGQTLYRVGDTLEFKGTQGLKTFGQWLQEQGYKKPTQYDSGVELGVGMTVQSIEGKTLRQIVYTNNQGEKRTVTLPIDEVREYTNYLEDKGYQYKIN